MSVTVPTLFRLLAGGGAETYAAELAITGSNAAVIGMSKAVSNSTWCYAKANRRTLLDWSCMGHNDDGGVGRQEMLTTAPHTSYEAVFEIVANLSTDTENLTFEARGTNLDVKVEFWADTVGGSSIGSISDTTAAATEEDMLPAASQAMGGDEVVVIEVSIRGVSSAQGSLFMLRVFEDDLVTGDLP